MENPRSLHHQRTNQKQKQKLHTSTYSKPSNSELHGQLQQQPQKQRQSASVSSSSPPPFSPSFPSSSSTAAPGNGGNVDKVLFNNLVEMVPLVETLMDRRVNTSFTRRASVIYTPTPAHPKKAKQSLEAKNRKATQTLSTKKKQEIGDSTSDGAENQDGGGDGFSIISSRTLAAEHAHSDKEESTMLRDQVDVLEKKLLEKDESLKIAENSLKSVHEALDDFKRQVAEKEFTVKTAHSQLNDFKIKLADKQAAFEKLQWEAREATNKIEKLQDDLDSADFEITTFMHIFEELSKNRSNAALDERITYFDRFDHLQNIDVDETAVEEAKLAYEAALTFAKKNPSEETLSLASEARIKLQSFVV